MKTRALVSLVLIAGTMSISPARPQRNRVLSPQEQASATIGGKTVTVDYSAPSMRGRKIFGELVPFGKVWRAGANAATTLYTDVDLDVGGCAIPKGAYSLYIRPEADQWTLIVNSQTGQSGAKYNEKMDLGRVPMKMSRSREPIETLKIRLSQTGAEWVQLVVAWENTIAWVNLSASSLMSGR